MEITRKPPGGKKAEVPTSEEILTAFKDILKKNPIKGEKGERGLKGDRGEIGPRGYKGDQGDAGEKGEIGPEGKSIVGEKGEKGDRGEPGAKGEKGDKGESITGPRGPVGKAGDKGRGIESITQLRDDLIQVNFTDDTKIQLELPRGEDGRTIELRALEKILQWKYTDEAEDKWRNLIDLTGLSSLQGIGGAGPIRLRLIDLSDVNPSGLADTYVPAWDIATKKFIFVPNGSGGGNGDVFGPPSSTNNAIARYDGITGKIIQNSLATIDDLGNLTATNFSGTSTGNNSGDQDLSAYALIASLALVAFSGDYNDLINLPTLVTDHGALTGLGDDDHLQYHTDARALTWLGTRSTSDLSEGSNLYYTDERVDDRAAALIQDGTGITWTYNDVGNTLTGNVTITQYSDEMAQDAIGAMIDGTLVYVDSTPLLTRAALTGDITSPQGSNATTLATVNSNVGSFGSQTSIPTFIVNAKGLITGASSNTIVAPAGFLSGSALNSGVTLSSLTVLGVQGQALDMGTHQIKNVVDPSVAQDAATKNYVDSTVTGHTVTLTGAVTGSGTSSIAVSLGSFTSSQLKAALTDETGSGANVFADTPTLIAPLLGTPTSGVLTNCTGLPLTSGVTGDLPFANLDQLTANSLAANATTGTADVAALAIAASRLVGRDASGNLAGQTVGGGIEFTTGGIQSSAYTGDATKTAGGTALTLATVNATTGSFGDGTHVGQFTVNAKGLITAASSVLISFPTTPTLSAVLTAGNTATNDITLTGILTVTGQGNFDNLRLDANTLSSTDTNGNLLLTPNGTGEVRSGASTTNYWRFTSTGIMSPIGSAQYQIPSNTAAFVAGAATQAGLWFKTSANRFSFTDTVSNEIFNMYLISAVDSLFGYSCPSTSPAQITANQNNYNGGGESGVVRIDTDAARNITGLQAPAGPRGKSVTHWYIGSNSAVYKHNDAGSTAANRLFNANGGDITLTNGQGVTYNYDVTSAIWRGHKLA